MGGEGYPEGVPKSINYPEIPLYALLENSARKHPNREAILYYGRRLSYIQLWDEVRRLASSLIALGLGKGDRVGIILPNTPHFPVAYYATLAAGGVVVAINPINPRDEVERELNEAGVELVISLDRFEDKVPVERFKVILARAESYLPWHLRVLVGLRRRTPQRKGLRFEELLKGPRLEKTVEVDPMRDLAAIQYSGGTSGPPKGVMLTHFNLVANALQSYHWARGWGYSPKPLPAGYPYVICAIPFFHIYGMTVALNEPILSSSTLILIPEPKPEEIMKAIQRYQATHFPATPRMIREIVEHPERGRYNLRSLVTCVTGGARMEVEVEERFRELTGAIVHHGYGLTEAGPVTHCTPQKCSKRGSAGLPYPDTKAKIVDLQIGEFEMPPGREGELVVSGPQVMVGYWKDPEATARALRGGWLYTGDVARMDEQGYIYIVERKDERVISSGHSVWPSRVEEVLMSHPSVEEAAAVGVLDPMRCATEIKAFIVLRPGWRLEDVRDSLMETCRKMLEPYEVPDRIVAVDSLPRTPLGKVNKKILREWSSHELS
ncbi:MAG: AMP-binding protein [Candidatus Bathyarchaeia archaeon]